MATRTGKNEGTVKKVSTFIKGVRAELKKVSWPTKKELTRHTIVVLITCGIMAFLVWVFDLAFRGILSQIIG